MRLMMPDKEALISGLKGLCPRCHKASIFKSKTSQELRDSCPECGLVLSDNDSADGPAVFIIFILGFLVVPLAIWLDHLIAMPLWLQGIIWGIVILGLTLGMLRPVKGYVIALMFRHRPEDWHDAP